MMLIPGFSASYVTMRTRLFLSIAISLAVGSMLVPTLEVEINDTPVGMLVAIFAEVSIGFMIGGLARIIGASIHIAGMIMSMQSAMAQAVLFDPSQGSQGAIFGNFMEITGLVLLFSLNLHHLLLLAIAGSYDIYPISELPDFALIADSAAALMSNSFLMAFQLASPLIIVGLLTNLASGLLARLMPSFQVFFVITPAQIMVSFFLLGATLSSTLMWYIHYLEINFTQFLQ